MDMRAGTPLRAAIFDLDGTLVATEEHNQVVWRAFLSERGVDWADDDLAARVIGRRGLDVLTEHAHAFGGETPQELYDAVLAVDARMTRPGPADPVAGAVELVRALAGHGVRLALVTSRWRVSAQEILALLGVLDDFEVLITAEDVTAGKPDPQGFLLALDRLGVAADDAIAFEDSAPGVASAVAAGLRTIAVTATPTAAVVDLAERVVTDLTAVDADDLVRHS
ncbi:MAG: mannitol-/sugar-/sorbitol-6-phosphatase [Frankiaceae bacterium]|nr:mannitol-/sugar-/sorbitol-6-phosphatase [Frankiaceae bacterium]